MKPLRASLEAVGIDYEHNEWLGGKGRAVVYDEEWNGTATKQGIQQVTDVAVCNFKLAVVVAYRKFIEFGFLLSVLLLNFAVLLSFS